MQRLLALITMIALLMSGLSQASVPCHAVSEPLVPVAQSMSSAMPCHQHNVENPTTTPSMILDESGRGDRCGDGCGDRCDGCANCVITGSASGLMHNASVTLTLRQGSLMLQSQAVVISLVLPLPDRPPIIS